jgi:streptomycin 6-kinase
VPIPETFRRRIRGAFGKSGEGWLERLPTLVTELCDRWRLSDLVAHEAPSYAWIAFAKSPSGPCVLKLAVPNPELETEAAALSRYRSDVAVLLLNADVSAGALLLERLTPGSPLRAEGDFQTRVEVAAELMARLHPAGTDELAACRSETAALPRYARQAERAFTALGGGTPGVSQTGAREAATNMIAGARTLLAGWSDSAHESLIHGDLHHDNILRDGSGWRLIDPKGVRGPRALEPARFIINQYGDAPESQRARQFEAMCARFADALGVSPRAIAHAAAIDAALSTCWSIEDQEPAEAITAGIDQALKTAAWATRY